MFNILNNPFLQNSKTHEFIGALFYHKPDKYHI